MKKLVWYAKQILPLKYDTTYICNDKKYLSVWNQWFGRVYNHKVFEIK